MRVTGFNVIIASLWSESDETERGCGWARQSKDLPGSLE
jgi:hypothetical protein